MDKLIVVGFLLVATVLESSGDAVVRMGIAQNAWGPRLVLFAAGAGLLFVYGLSLNLAPLDFGRVIGLYIATLFVVWQVVNFAFFRAVPSMATLVGGAMIVIGGCVATFWQR